MADEGKITAGQAQRLRGFPEEICQLLTTVSLGQFQSHGVRLSSSKTLAQPPFESV